MNKKIGLLFIVAIILLINIPFATSSIPSTHFELSKVRDKIYVNINNTQGPWNGSINAPYKHIQDAVENSTTNDEIFVFKGLYKENIIIYKTLIITGENKNNTIIDGMYNNYILSITHNNVNINNFTIQNSGGYKNDAGFIINSEGNKIDNCVFARTKTGIIINRTNNNEINNCIFHTNGEGIFINTAFQNNIYNSYFTHNGIGINMLDSYKISVYECYTETNGIGVFIDNSFSIDIIKCALYNNNDNQGGIFLDKSNNIHVENSNIFHNGFGIKMDNSFDVYIINSSIFSNTHYGVYIDEESENIVIKNNEIKENLRIGVYVKDSSCRLIRNNFNRSLLGLYSEHGKCKAIYNWWGSVFGPSFFEREKAERIHIKRGSIIFFPWLFNKVENAGANWEIDFDLYTIEINNTRYKQIELLGEDNDLDGVPNWWEEKWGYDPLTWDDHSNIDPDNDGLNNIEECYTDEYGSSPFIKDIFLEFDWVETKDDDDPSNKPPIKYVNKIVNKFQDNNISLHVDLGDLDGGEEIPYIVNFSYSDLRDIYWDFFLHNDLNNPRKGIFHYCIVCAYGAGPGFAFIGLNHLDSFQISAQMILDKNPILNRGRAIIGGSIHELGHTLGLTVDDHGGNDNIIATMLFNKQWWKYRNYRSCMNYRYTYQILDFSDGDNGIGDFDDWSNLDFGFFKNTHFIIPQ